MAHGTFRAPIPVLTSIAGLAPSREVWLTDIWGVIPHNGVAPFAPACEATTKFRLAGGTVILLSNAPRPASSVVTQLDRLGVPRFAWDAILTSGDAARALVGADAGKRVFHLGPERDLSLYDDLGVTLAGRPMPTPSPARASSMTRSKRRTTMPPCSRNSRRASCP